MMIDVGDKVVERSFHKDDPHISVFEDFLSRKECDFLCQMAEPRLQPSQVWDRETAGSKPSNVRTSHGVFLKYGENMLIRCIENRLQQLTRMRSTHGEDLHILRYEPGQEYKPHHDYFELKDPGAKFALNKGGQRIVTVIMYLKEPVEGGETQFLDIGITVTPKLGSALLFAYPNEDKRLRHAGLPVIKGQKWIATKWLRENEILDRG